MGYRYIVVEGRGGYDPQEPIESWELKGTKSNGVGESLVMSDDKMHKFNKPYPIVNTTKDIAGSEVKFWRNLVDTMLNKGVLLSESGDNKLYFVVPAHGFGNIGRILYLTFNQQHDGTYGAITSGLSEARNTGVRETSLAAIPTDSATGGQTSNQQTSQPSSQQSQSSSNSSYEDYINSLKAKPIDQLTDKELDALIEWQTGGDVGDPSKTTVDLEAAKNLDLQG